MRSPYDTLPRTCRRAVAMQIVLALVGIALATRPALAQQDVARPTSGTGQLAQTIDRLEAHLAAQWHEKNAVCSPSSVLLALAMAYEGAEGRTAEEIANLLGLPNSPTELRRAISPLLSSSARLGVAVQANDGYGLRITRVVRDMPGARGGLESGDLLFAIADKPVTSAEQYEQCVDEVEGEVRIAWFDRSENRPRDDIFHIPPKNRHVHLANAIWLDRSFPLEQEYAAVLADFYGAAARHTALLTDPAAAAQQMHQWLQQETGDRLSSLLQPSDLNRVPLVLMNAVHLQAEWEEPFTRLEKGLPWNGSTLTVPAMSKRAVVPLIRTQDFEAIELPYKDSPLALTIVLPRQGLPWRDFCDLVRTLPEARRGIGFTRTHVEIVLPKFTIQQQLELGASLKQLLPTAFSQQQANFSGISQRAVYLSELVHLAAIDVDEKGTEAAAASGAIIALKGEPAPEYRFIVDRPFLFFLYDKTSGATLFAGQLIEPEPLDK